MTRSCFANVCFRDALRGVHGYDWTALPLMRPLITVRGSKVIEFTDSTDSTASA